MPHQPVQVYAVEVPAGDIAIPAHVDDLPANLRITMAALDPSAPAQLDLAPTGQTVPRATLKIVKIAIDEDEDDEDDEDYDSDDIAALEARLKPALGGSDDDSEEDEDSDDNSEEENGGPSDPAKSKKARKAAAVKALLESLKDDDEMDTDELPNGVNGIKSNKGKARASDDDEESDLDDDEGELEEYVICTLDTTQHYQQPIDITINEGEQVFFKVVGTHSVFLTGNYIADVQSDSEDEDSEDDDEMDYYGEGLEDDSDDMDEEIDELDDLADPRITEVDSEDEAPRLVKANAKAEKKGKNKRPADDSEEEAVTLDALISKSEKSADAANINGEKLSKKQAKKLKNNQGVAVSGAEKQTNGTAAAAKSDKKVQFAKNLEQGPTGSPLPKVDAKADAKNAKKEDAAPQKSGLGVKMVQGVKIDDKKLGKGPAAKKGDKIGMRYIGKLENGKVFDSNKKGKPFTFSLGKGDVITGWDIGVAGMTVGGERRLTIPSKLAYGNKSLPGIPSNSTLIFDVKLITIN